MNKFSVTALKALRAPGFHSDGGGLYVRVRDTGGRSFVFVSTRGGKRRETVIGPVGDVTLAEAREARDRLRRGEGLRAATGDAPTFGQWADSYVAEHESGWSNTHPHRVPLTDRMIAILHEMRCEELGPDDLLFPGRKAGKTLANTSLLALLERMGHDDITVHGFRSAFRDFAGEETEHAESVAEAALAHSVGDSTVRAYRRGDSLERRRRLMIDWHDWVCGVPAEPAPAEEFEVAPPAQPADNVLATERAVGGRKKKDVPGQTTLL